MLGLGLTGTSYNGAGYLPTDADGLHAWYKSGTGVAVDGWADSSSNSNDATAASGNEVGNIVDGGLQFVGSNSDFLDFNQVTFSGAFTLFWVINMASYDSQNTIFGKGSTNTQFLEMQSLTQMRFKSGSATSIFKFGGPENFPLDVRYLITVTRDGDGNMKIYKNGSELSQVNSTGLPNTGGFIIDSLGIRNDSDRAFDGIMYEVILYTEEKTGDELSSLHSYLTGRFGL
jgi:hypothetical protein